ncbi:hypothetical protein GCM10027285_11670 [Oleiagrimonas citrea]|jgi:hypothetical protein|uniref:Sulfotransferase family 2 domain-containing protein n=1 Tax=Oleiagrimonas citrea TaxID=1665687 RepID=A0A846ZLE1_9GAMM|nr:sulfotransferase family 2 domain-containing protein [Oleiagrimonas citrea]NKZ38273.1 sulfotransferase family 2 domain-containing protein [Oleiagrimonas citrea]
MPSKLFLHMPKCAGSSVKKMLLECAGDRVVIDNDTLFALPPADRNTVIEAAAEQPALPPPGKIVYGHFYPVKYLGGGMKPASAGDDFRMVTILRDPLERMVSHYRFWQTHEHPENHVWSLMHAGAWSFETFALGAPMQNFYAQYLTRISLEQFTYIGILENFPVSVEKCMRVMGVSHESCEIPVENRTRNGIAYPSFNDDFIDRFVKHHAEDYAIYLHAVRTYHSMHMLPPYLARRLSN